MPSLANIASCHYARRRTQDSDYYFTGMKVILLLPAASLVDAVNLMHWLAFWWLLIVQKGMANIEFRLASIYM